jgi:hypothetical protein
MKDQDTQQPTVVPNGYRQAIVTAITVILGFSLYFLRYWSFEASGDWTVPSVIAAAAMLVSIVVQVVALARSLSLSDDNPKAYSTTVRVFIWGVVLALASVVFASVTVSGIFGK